MFMDVHFGDKIKLMKVAISFKGRQGSLLKEKRYYWNMAHGRLLGS